MLDDTDLDLTLGDDEDEGGGWLDSLRSFSRPLFSLVIFLGSLVFLFWNENAGKQHSDAIAEAGKVAVSVSSHTSIDPTLEGKAVHVSGQVSSASGVRDPHFAIRSNGVGLYRAVYMYQWIEYKETRGKGAKRRTTYHYEMDWDSVWHDSSKFHEPAGHQNPPMPLQSEAFFAEDARFGPYRFDNPEVLEQALREFDERDPSSPALPGDLSNWPQYLEQLPPLRPELVSKRWYQIEPDEYYRGNEHVEHYELGDLSVNFYAFRNDYPLSMIAAQQGDRLVKWSASNGDQILLAAGGSMSAAQVSSEAQATNQARIRFYRILGLFGSMLGCVGMISSVAGLLGMIPGIGRLIEMSLVVSGMLIGLSLGLVTIVLGWLVARPWIGLLLLVGLVAVFGWGGWKQRLAEKARRQAERIARATATARQRAAERLAMPPLPGSQPALAGAAAGMAGAAGSAAPGPAMPPPTPGTMTRQPGMPPPPPGSSTASSPSVPAGAVQAGAGTPSEPDELPPLEWTPGASSKPPAVMPKRSDAPRPYGASDDDVEELPPLAWDGSPLDTGSHASAQTPAVPATPSTAAPVTPARASADTAKAPSATGPLWEEVEPRDGPVRPLWAQAPLAEEGFAGLQANPQAKPAASAGASAPAAGLASAVATAAAAGVTAAAKAASITSRAAATTADAAAQPPATPGHGQALRRKLGERGGYQINELLRRQADGSLQRICFELMQNGKPLKRGSQEAVKGLLAELLARKQG